MEVSGQLRIPTALLLLKDLLYSFYIGGWGGGGGMDPGGYRKILFLALIKIFPSRTQPVTLKIYI
jgi:hypothetical protein